jgi:hypothetical protein
MANLISSVRFWRFALNAFILLIKRFFPATVADCEINFTLWKAEDRDIFLSTIGLSLRRVEF